MIGTRKIRKILLIGLLTFLIANKPGVVYAGVNGWTSNGPVGGNILSLAIDATNHGILYAGTGGNGVFKSTNGGENWNAANIGLANSTINDLAIDPLTTTTIYAGTGSGVFKSTDAGANWYPVNTGLKSNNVFSLAIDPAIPGILFAGTEYDGVFKSTDGGGNWSSVSTELPNYGTYYALAIDPVASGTIYVGVKSYYGSGVFKSTNGGENWIAVNTGLTNTSITTLEIYPTISDRLYAGTEGGVFTSADGGGNWSAIGLSDRYINALAVDPTNPGILYVGTTYDGVLKTTDGGGTWNETNIGLGEAETYQINALAIDPVTPGTLYAATLYSGVVKSTNGGGNWDVATTGLTVSSVSSLAVSSAISGMVYAGIGNGGIFKSKDSGANWSSISESLACIPVPFVKSVAVDPFTPGKIYSVTGCGIYRTTDDGKYWFKTSEGEPWAWDQGGVIAIDPRTPSTMYLGNGGYGVYKSTDGGGSWKAVNTGLTQKVTTLVIDPVTPSTLYAGTEFGIFKTIDGGDHWSAINTGLTLYLGWPYANAALSIDSSDPNTLFAEQWFYEWYPNELSFYTLYKTTNGGDSWSPVNTDLPDATIRALVVDPVVHGTVYAGVPGYGIFRTTDGGAHWNLLNTGLTNFNVQALAIDPSYPGTIYAGTDGGGVFAFERLPATLTVNHPRSAPGGYFTFIGANFPPNKTVTVSVNGNLLGTLQTDSSGNFTLLLSTNQAEEGQYIVSATADLSASTSFAIDIDSDLEPQEGTGTIFPLPGGLAYTHTAYLPLLQK